MPQRVPALLQVSIFKTVFQFPDTRTVLLLASR
jgi:hypothetical protein